jgi:methionine sulfoxide reductase heme-binding subunit
MAGLWQPSKGALLAIRLVVFMLCLVPAVYLAWGAWRDALGANPIEAITHATGEWTLRLLLVGLAITPLRRLTGLDWLVRLRRMLGLYAFFYGCLHLVTYVWLDQFFDWGGILHDIAKRPFITVGFAAIVVMLLLAATSFNAAMRALGGKRWQALHRLVYAAVICGVLHYWWLVKRDLTWPIFYALILVGLLSFRAFRKQRAAGRRN